MIAGQLEVNPALRNAKPSGDSTESGRATADADESLLFVDGAVLLETPAKIDLLDQIRAAKGVGKGHSATILTEEFKIIDEKCNGLIINSESDLVAKLDVVFLSPLAEAKATVDAADKPIVNGLLERVRGGKMAEGFQKLNHVGSERFSPIFHALPSGNFLETVRNGGSKSIVAVSPNGAEPGQGDTGVSTGICFSTPLDRCGCIGDIVLDCLGFDGFAQECVSHP
jgi:hypothetical protein